MQFCLLVLTVLCGSVLWAEDGSNIPPFRVGFSRRLFTDVNENDAKASIRAWAQVVARERGLNMSPAAQLFDNVAQMTAAMKNGAVEAICAPFDDYFVIACEVQLSECFAIQMSGDVLDEYLLLVRADGPIRDLPALQGQRLVFHNSARMCLATDWLDTLLLTNGWSGAEGFFREVTRLQKLSPSVLRVFFRQADACLVEKSGFTTMCELNPQLRSKIKILASSPPLLPGVMFFRKDFDSPEKGKIMAALEGLHETPTGQQVLTLFQSEKLVPISQAQLGDTESFLHEARRLRSATTLTLSIEASPGPTPAGDARP